MNACPNRLAELTDAAEGRLTPSLEAHLPECADCRGRLRELREGLELVTPDPAPAPGPWLAARIRARAEARKARRTRWLILGSGGVAVVGAFLVMMGWTASQPVESVDAPAEVWAAVTRDLDRDPAAVRLANELPFEGLRDVAASDLDRAEARVYGLEPEHLDPADYDPWAPTLGLDLESELSGASEAELAALLDRLPG